MGARRIDSFEDGMIEWPPPGEVPAGGLDVMFPEIHGDVRLPAIIPPKNEPAIPKHDDARGRQHGSA